MAETGGEQRVGGRGREGQSVSVSIDGVVQRSQESDTASFRSPLISQQMLILILVCEESVTRSDLQCGCKHRMGNVASTDALPAFGTHEGSLPSPFLCLSFRKQPGAEDECELCNKGEILAGPW